LCVAPGFCAWAITNKARIGHQSLLVDDFGDDGIPDLYLNFDNPFGYVPKEWQKREYEQNMLY